MVQKVFTVITTTIVSLVIGVGSGFLINYTTEKRLGLMYDLTSIEVFPGQTQKIGIISVRVSNTGGSRSCYDSGRRDAI